MINQPQTLGRNFLKKIHTFSSSTRKSPGPPPNTFPAFLKRFRFFFEFHQYCRSPRIVNTTTASNHHPNRNVMRRCDGMVALEACFISLKHCISVSIRLANRRPIWQTFQQEQIVKWVAHHYFPPDAAAKPS